jgi:hypothetical protein
VIAALKVIDAKIEFVSLSNEILDLKVAETNLLLLPGSPRHNLPYKARKHETPQQPPLPLRNLRQSEAKYLVAKFPIEGEIVRHGNYL